MSIDKTGIPGSSVPGDEADSSESRSAELAEIRSVLAAQAEEIVLLWAELERARRPWWRRGLRRAKPTRVCEGTAAVAAGSHEVPRPLVDGDHAQHAGQVRRH